MSQLHALPRCGAAGALAAPAALRAQRARHAAPRAARAARALPPRAALASEDEVAIRRRPPQGTQKLDVGSTFDFKMETINRDGQHVDNEEFKPRNILEEIVWYKDVELQRVRAFARVLAGRGERGCSRRGAPCSPSPERLRRRGVWRGRARGARGPLTRHARRCRGAPRGAVEAGDAAGDAEEGGGCGAAGARLCGRAAQDGGRLGHAGSHRGGQEGVA
jgi:hypothetical protein